MRIRPATPEERALLLGKATPEPVERLRGAIADVLTDPGIGWTLRQRLVAARQALDLPPDAAPAPVRPVGAPASPTTRPSQRGDVRWVRRAVRGVYWPIAEAAIDQGFRPQRTGTGHVRLCRGSQAFTLTTTDTAGHGRGYENAKAAARRAGVEL